MTQTRMADIPSRVAAFPTQSKSELRVAQRILEVSPDAVYVYDLVENRNVFTNNNIAEILGYSSEQIAAFGESLLADLIHDGDLNRTLDHHIRLMNADDDEMLEIEYRARRADGTWAWLMSRDTPFERGPDGSVTRILGMASDITERKRTELELAERESIYRLIAESMREMICMHGADGTFVYVSPSVTELVGWAPDDLVGKSPYEFFHPNDVERIRDTAHADLLKGDTQAPPVRYRFRCPDGSYRLVETLSRPHFGENGEVDSLHTSTRDITERDALERRLTEAQRAETLARVAETIAGGLSEASTGLRRDTSALGDLATSHDEERLVRAISRSTDRIETLTRELAAFSMAQTRPVERFDLSDFAVDSMALLKRAAGAGVRLALELSADPAEVDAHRPLMENALMALVTNAADAMPDGGTLRVAVSRQVVDEPMVVHRVAVPAGEWAVISVEDTGTGMSPETLERALDSIFTTKDKGTGTGVGLSAVQFVLEQVGGVMVLESTEGQGTKASCYVPAVAVASNAALSGNSHCP